jgi:hypothetical protein
MEASDQFYTSSILPLKLNSMVLVRKRTIPTEIMAVGIRYTDHATTSIS